MIKVCIKCNSEYKTPEKRRKYCSRDCYVKSGIPAKNLGGYTKSEFIAERNSEHWFRKKVSDGLKKHFAKNPRKKERWYIEKYGEGYIPKADLVGNNRHSKKWQKISRDLRSKYDCQRCGLDKPLDVHHIIPFSISKDNSLKNLIVLCRKCHMFTEHNNIQINKILGGDWEMTRLLYKLRMEDGKVTMA